MLHVSEEDLKRACCEAGTEKLAAPDRAGLRVPRGEDISPDVGKRDGSYCC